MEWCGNENELNIFKHKWTKLWQGVHANEHLPHHIQMLVTLILNPRILVNWMFIILDYAKDVTPPIFKWENETSEILLVKKTFGLAQWQSLSTWNGWSLIQLFLPLKSHHGWLSSYKAIQCSSSNLSSHETMVPWQKGPSFKRNHGP